MYYMYSQSTMLGIKINKKYTMQLNKMVEKLLHYIDR